jgi:OmpA-OmpF porin, OOP family
MRLTKKSKGWAISLTLTVAGLGLLAGCGGGDGSSGGTSQGSGSASVTPQLSASLSKFCSPGGPVVLAVSGRQNSPAPGLTPCMAAAVATAAGDGSGISIVNVDGTPTVTKTGYADTAGMNPTAKQAYEENFESGVANAVQAVRAVSPHADVLDALNLAGRVIRSTSAHGGTVFLEDSGLQDIAPLDFAQQGQLEALPANVVSFLVSQGELPDLTGVTVVLVGIGDTAPPQQPLDIGLQNHLHAIWSAIIEAGGGRVETDSYPRQAAAPDHVPTVALVRVPALKPWPGRGTSLSLLDAGPVGFEPNTAKFRDPSAARSALGEIAGYLLDNPAARIELTGTTAHFDGDAWDKTLSTERADAVKSALVALGATAGQMTARGDGWESPCYENDGGPTGPIINQAAEHNRSVIVTLLPHAVTCPS